MRMTKKVQKRSGAVVNFRKSYIRNDIIKAAVDAGISETEVGELVDKIVDEATNEIENRFYRYDLIPNVENIYDIVEKLLFKHSLFDVVRQYIVQRENRRNEWLNKKDKLSHLKKFKVIKRDGSKEQFNFAKLSDFLAECIDNPFPLENISSEDILNMVLMYIYDNIETSKVIDALIFVVTSMFERDLEYETLAARMMLRKMRKEVLHTSYVYGSEESNQQYKDKFIQNIKYAVEQGLLHDQLLNGLDDEFLSELIDPALDEKLGYIGLCTLYDRYLLRDKDGRLLELPQYFFARIACGVSLYEPEEKKKEVIRDFYYVYSNLLFMPSTPTLFNAGTWYSQTASCYLNTVDDNLNSIFRVYRDNALMSKHSGGIATDWSYIRATGAKISSINIESQGVVPFLKILNDTTIAISRSGRRRGATAVYLEVWHYDIEDFCDLRRNVGDERRRTHDLNTAVWVPDLFMERVLENKEWTLFSPDETPDLHRLYGNDFRKAYEEYERKAEAGEIRLYKKVKAKKLWIKIINSLYTTGHPWICYKDTINLRSPQDHDGVVHSSNLCTEITLNTKASKLDSNGCIEELGETAVCVLGSLVLPNFVQDGKFDFELLEKVVRIAIRHLDNVIDVCYYPIPEAEKSSTTHRALGMGCMGLQDALWKLGYGCIDNKKAYQFCHQLYERISYFAIDQSSDLAKERGPYKTFKGSKWDRGIFPFDTLEIVRKHRSQEKYCQFPELQLELDWNSLKEKVKKYGMRNSHVLAIAPTATIATICGVTCPSVEPIYKNLFVRSNMTGEFIIFNRYLVEDLKKAGVWNKDIIDQIKYYDGSIQRIKEIPDEIKKKYKTAFEIDQRVLVDLAAIRGAFIDQSQSLNIFMDTTDGNYVSNTYIHAWKRGLKTTYYLRTLGASGIEKSSLDIKKYGYTQLRDKAQVCSLDGGECEACQ